MKWYRGPEGDQRLWFDPDEIEALAEGELRKAGLLTTPDAPVVDLERFIESHLRVELDQYAELDKAILGVSEFRAGRQPRIMINRDLTGSALDEEDPLPGTKGRWRATLAHEATHVMLHQVLFDLDDRQGSLFTRSPAQEPSGAMMRCLKREVAFTTTARDWREVQANRGMAALLMPRSVFVEVARHELARAGLESGRLVGESKAAASVAAALAGRFDVSRAAAVIRLRTLGFVQASEKDVQLPLDGTGG